SWRKPVANSHCRRASRSPVLLKMTWLPSTRPSKSWPSRKRATTPPTTLPTTPPLPRTASMLQAFRNALVIPDWRAKLLVTIGLLAIYRLLVHIPTPGVDIEALQGGALSSEIFSLLNFISGGNFEVFSIAALGV